MLFRIDLQTQKSFIVVEKLYFAQYVFSIPAKCGENNFNSFLTPFKMTETSG